MLYSQKKKIAEVIGSLLGHYKATLVNCLQRRAQPSEFTHYSMYCLQRTSAKIVDNNFGCFSISVSMIFFWMFDFLRYQASM